MTKEYERTKIYVVKRLLEGKCSTGCGKVLRTKYLCDECSKKASYKNNRVRNKKRLDLINQGICSTDNCGNKLATKWLCRICQDKCNQCAKNWWNKDPEGKKKKYNEYNQKYRFSGLRHIVVERDKNVCQICFRENKKVHVHHINENDKDNRMENLICLCFICHIVIERINSTKPNLRHLFPWFI